MFPLLLYFCFVLLCAGLHCDEKDGMTYPITGATPMTCRMDRDMDKEIVVLGNCLLGVGMYVRLIGVDSSRRRQCIISNGR